MKKKRIAQAAKLYENFTGHRAKRIDTVSVPGDDVGIVIGKCSGIMYETVRDGKKEHYIHEFSKNSRPVFAVSFDGKRLYLLAGAYKFTERGIVDKKE